MKYKKFITYEEAINKRNKLYQKTGRNYYIVALYSNELFLIERGKESRTIEYEGEQRKISDFIFDINFKRA
jgi:hypothetical protein